MAGLPLFGVIRIPNRSGRKRIGFLRILGLARYEVRVVSAVILFLNAGVVLYRRHFCGGSPHLYEGRRFFPLPIDGRCAFGLWGDITLLGHWIELFAADISFLQVCLDEAA